MGNEAVGATKAAIGPTTDMHIEESDPPTGDFTSSPDAPVVVISVLRIVG
jgi:hypothetical protein